MANNTKKHLKVLKWPKRPSQTKTCKRFQNGQGFKTASNISKASIGVNTGGGKAIVCTIGALCRAVLQSKQ